MRVPHWVLLGLVAGLSFLGEFSFPHDAEHAFHWWNSVPAFYAIYGFVGCAAIVLISKWLGRLFMQQKEDYYDAG